MTSQFEFDSILIVSRKTQLEELITKFNTRLQANFYIEQQAQLNPKYRGGSFDEYQKSHDAYQNSLQQLKQAIPKNMKFQVIERSLLPMFKFSGRELVVTIGPDGLVINTAKYLSVQPIF
ncbi:hypothetical protein HYY75_08525 [bacterium]|nr:hypothetical protein [bacterium]